MKGHSERVPGKNMRLFNGRPLYHAVMSVLQACPEVSSIIINTDSSEIAGDALKNFSKVKIHERPENLCGDFVPMNDIIAYDLSKLDGDDFIQTHSTNPLLRSVTISKAADRYFKRGDSHDSLFSVTRLQTRLYWKDGNAINHNPSELLRTQDLPVVYEENSNFYFFSKASFKTAGNKRIGLSPILHEIPKVEAVDIDEPEDFLIAEVLYSSLHMKAETK
jgi:CMP-N-acetylneuraminic acid synthetase